MRQKKCEYCNVSINANCHGHKIGCPYSCNTEKPKPDHKPIGSLPASGIDCLFTFIIIYFGYKLFKKYFNLWTTILTK